MEHLHQAPADRVKWKEGMLQHYFWWRVMTVIRELPDTHVIHSACGKDAKAMGGADPKAGNSWGLIGTAVQDVRE